MTSIAWRHTKKPILTIDPSPWFIGFFFIDYNKNIQRRSFKLYRPHRYPTFNKSWNTLNTYIYMSSVGVKGLKVYFFWCNYSINLQISRRTWRVTKYVWNGGATYKDRWVNHYQPVMYFPGLIMCYEYLHLFAMYANNHNFRNRLELILVPNVTSTVLFKKL